MPRSFRQYIRIFSLCLSLGMVSHFVSGCASTPPYHGFADKATLDDKDTYVIKESSGGSLDPMNLALDDQQYAHSNMAYSRVEEGYYQWGRHLYQMGYRDIYYVKDLAPHAFRHEVMDVYDHAIVTGYEDAQKQDSAGK